jgi:signal transduction histidine kinase/CheY-like chemotaxis protein/HPt (histidine-containing phosphotransfer) domain-containing protein
MKEKVPSLVRHQTLFIEAKQQILEQWLSYKSPKEILELHAINENVFIQKYASGVFDYFMGVIAGETEIGDCPVMQELLSYLKFREISADELFEICRHFRRSMIDFAYDANLNSKELFDEISYIFDKNFTGILKYYTDTIFQKLIDARQEALQAGQAKEYFLSNMSHEIRTPLNAILGFVNLLREEGVSKKHKNYLEIILNSGENLLSIINDILDFSKLRSGEFTIEPKIFSLHDELNHTLELFVASANSKEITISSFIDPSIPRELYGDSLRIKQIVSNLLSNAIKFTPVNGLIEVEAQCSNKLLRISVKDSGIGIAEDDIENIFSAFSQAQHTEQESGGTGLGLSISNQLAELMGGKVNVSSVVDEGSTFYVEIPIEVHHEECLVFDDIEEFQKLKMLVYAKEKKPSFRHKSFLRYAEYFKMDVTISDSIENIDFDIAIFADAECDMEFKKSVLDSDKMFMVLMSRENDFYTDYKNINYLCFPLYCSKIHAAFYELMNPEAYIPTRKIASQKFLGHILVAEDNEANQELIKILLEKYGLTFDLAENGLVAFNLYKMNKYDLVLMDEQMPEMDGNEAVAKILEYEKMNNLSHTPISALTANVIKGAKERGLLSGYDAFLGKPIILKDLERVLVSYLPFNESSMKSYTQGEEEQIIEGLDAKKLQVELMLSSDELIMLLSLFLKKMSTTIPELQNAIIRKDYKKIALMAHSIKGSSGNFRIKFLQKSASEMEQMAKREESNYAYESVCALMKSKLDSIKII